MDFPQDDFPLDVSFRYLSNSSSFDGCLSDLSGFFPWQARLSAILDVIRARAGNSVSFELNSRASHNCPGIYRRCPCSFCLWSTSSTNSSIRSVWCVKGWIFWDFPGWSLSLSGFQCESAIIVDITTVRDRVCRSLRLGNIFKSRNACVISRNLDISHYHDPNVRLEYANNFETC